MIGIGIFELGLGLLTAALIVYLTFRDRVATVTLVLLVVGLSPIVGIFLAGVVGVLLNALFVN